MSDPRTVRSVLAHLTATAAIPAVVRESIAVALISAKNHACTGCTEWRNACTCDGRRF